MELLCIAKGGVQKPGKEGGCFEVEIWKGVEIRREYVAGSEESASAVMGEYFDGGEEALEAFEVKTSAVLREGVSGGGDVMQSNWEDVLMTIPLESSISIAEGLGAVVVVVKLAISASVFSLDMFALFERL